MNQETLQNLFIEQIQDLYDAERQLVKALPKLAEAVESVELAEAIRSHLTETETHVSRLEQLCQTIGVKAEGKACKGMEGLIKEGDEAAKQKDEGYMRDLAIIAGAQKVEHYEISAYGTARTLAERLDMEDAAELLQQTHEEEEEADSKLTEVAESIYDSTEEMADDVETVPRESSASGHGSSDREK